MTKRFLATFISVFCVVASSVVYGGIVGSKHDLSVSNYYGPEASASKEICVFCHTPHGASDSIKGPIWNRKITNMSAFQMYGLDGNSSVNPVEPSAVSMACLSCHDGVLSQGAVSAVDAYDGHNILNPPNGDPGSPNCNACHPDGGVYPKDIWQIGPILTDDHPVSILYQTSMSNYPDEFNDPASFDRVKLFGGKVECASCHDVHNPDNGTFLRKPNTDGALCLTCHKK